MNLTNRWKIIKVCILGITMTFILDIPLIIFHLLTFVKSTNRTGTNFDNNFRQILISIPTLNSSIRDFSLQISQIISNRHFVETPNSN